MRAGVLHTVQSSGNAKNHLFVRCENGTSVETETETFPGKERRAALARFAELKKQYPGIVAEMDIEKKSWER